MITKFVFLNNLKARKILENVARSSINYRWFGDVRSSIGRGIDSNLSGSIFESIGRQTQSFFMGY